MILFQKLILLLYCLKILSILKNHLVSETDLFLEYNETNAMFTFENTTIICRLIDGKVPKL